jgi:hypothetical protein
MNDYIYLRRSKTKPAVVGLFFEFQKIEEKMQLQYKYTRQHPSSPHTTGKLLTTINNL